MADASSHARHDRFAIAASIGGATPPPRTIASCPRCGELHRDLLSIQTALRHAWTPRRPRDLHLAAIDIARIRPALWRRVLGAVGSSRDAITRPLAIGLTSVGIVGVMVSGTPFAFDGAASGAASSEAVIDIAAAPEPGPTHAKAASDERPQDLRLAASLGSVAAGGSLLVLRRAARRLRGVG